MSKRHSCFFLVLYQNDSILWQAQEDDSIVVFSIREVPLYSSVSSSSSVGSVCFLKSLLAFGPNPSGSLR